MILNTTRDRPVTGTYMCNETLHGVEVHILLPPNSDSYKMKWWYSNALGHSIQMRYIPHTDEVQRTDTM